MSSGKPLVIEAAINGSTPKDTNPNVPRTVDEIVTTALACIDAGAAIVHNHNDEPNVGEPSAHSPDPYETAWRRVWQTRPGVLMHPTTSGERTRAIADRFSHIVKLHQRGALTMATADAGCLSLAFDAPDGPTALPVFGNSAADVDHVFQWCREVDLPLHVSIFEPGFLRLTLAHHNAGRLPKRTKIQLYFGGPSALFGLPPTQASLNSYVEMISGTGLPWMVGVPRGDVLGSGLAEAALRAGGHIRVGLEDYAGPERSANEELVARAADLGARLGRPAAGVNDVIAALWG
ncbi:3-keto-5-aminohexanoate cleavage protein [Nocardia sp. ET3-3]|uniref:3-keto-5-aminohexanoate cleavage protein n=1 Tax=Nocardia terrae TaxID=2675851 RepID=A0A7K1UUB5_9NOCA|nr:3-keto-5-aminohexanoate cleavage protein [Nocardia terrae]